MTLIHNERTKLTATYVNGIAIALFAVGTIAPIIGSQKFSIITGITGLVCLFTSLALHLTARRILKGLEP